MLKRPDIPIDPRFDLETNWKLGVEPSIENGKKRGLEITPITIYYEDGSIKGWDLHGWKRPDAIIVYTSEVPVDIPIDFVI